MNKLNENINLNALLKCIGLTFWTLQKIIYIGSRIILIDLRTFYIHRDWYFLFFWGIIRLWEIGYYLKKSTCISPWNYEYMYENVVCPRFTSDLYGGWFGTLLCVVLSLATARQSAKRRVVALPSYRPVVNEAHQTERCRTACCRDVTLYIYIYTRKVYQISHNNVCVCVYVCFCVRGCVCACARVCVCLTRKNW
jgi:hypothetical protein